jgi:tRNA (guanine-N7-)-methyltransferase
MAKDKLRRFAEFRQFAHCFDFAYDMKGKWKSDFFKNHHPLVLEVGCGKGEYTVNMAKAFAKKNFLGIDIKSNRMWKGATIALEERINNVAFMRALVNKLPELFAPSEVDEIWITFPDPFPKDRHEKHRLTSKGFLEKYAAVIKPDGIIHLKTDDDELFEYTLNTLDSLSIKADCVIWDVYANPESPDLLTHIQTHYERLFMSRGRTIKYVSFNLKSLHPDFVK